MVSTGQACVGGQAQHDYVMSGAALPSCDTPGRHGLRIGVRFSYWSMEGSPDTIGVAASEAVLPSGVALPGRARLLHTGCRAASTDRSSSVRGTYPRPPG